MPPLYKVLASIFDMISGIVSLLDLATDLIILIIWYYDGKIVFFTISLCILILAQLSYLILFYYNHGRNTRDTACHSIVSVICTVPFAPFLSFIFYFVSANDSYLRNIIDNYLFCYNFEWYSFSSDTYASPKQQYLEEQGYKHIGFLLEATIEALPQSILQLTFIVYYNHPTPLSIVSILVSMTSVCSKLFIMVWAGIGLNGTKNRLFFWLCFVLDFFSIFFITSFAFYVPNEISLQHYFATFRTICIYQFMIGVLPFAIIASLGVYLYFIARIIQEQDEGNCLKLLIGIFLLFILGISLFLVFLLLEIFCVLYCGYTVLYFNTISRLPNKAISKEFYMYYIQWIMNEAQNVLGLDHEVLITRKQDRIIRLCIVNKILLEHHPNHKQNDKPPSRWGNYYDKELYHYLDTQKTTRFMNVTLGEMRSSCKKLSDKDLNWGHGPRHSQFMPAFWHHLYGHALKKYRKTNVSVYNTIAVIATTLLTYIFGPIYLLSRGSTLLLPWFIVLYLYIDGVNMFVQIHIFQLIMWSAYVVLLVLWCLLLFFIIWDDYYLWHILPSTQFFSGFHTKEKNDLRDKQINEYYLELTMYPIVETVIRQYFGHDICCVIMNYYNAIESFECMCTSA